MTTAEKSQPMRALEIANEVRFARAQLKARIRGGEITVAEALYLHADTVATMRISELLQAQSRWGEGRTRKLLGLLNLSWNKKCGTLTARQRDLVAQFVEGRI